MAAHEDREEALAAYALGALDEHDRPDLEAHLSTCAPCREALEGLRRLTAGIGLSIEPVSPPPDLRARVLAKAVSETAQRPAPAMRTGSGDALGPKDSNDFVAHTEEQLVSVRTSTTHLAPYWAFAMAAGLVLAVAASIYAWRLAGDLRNEQRQIAQLEARMSVLSSPDVVRVALAGQPDAPAAAGRAYLSASHGLVFTAQHLPALQAGRAYQLWVVTKKAPLSVGMLTMDANGNVTTTMPMPIGVNGDAVAVAVTIEAEGGVPAPTGPKVLVGLVAPQ